MSKQRDDAASAILMATRPAWQRMVRQETGAALIWALMLSMVGALMVGALSMALLSNMSGARTARGGEVARGAAEAGINAAAFRIEAGSIAGGGPSGIETYLAGALGAASAGGARPGTRQFTGTLAGSNYVVTLRDPAAGDGTFTLTSVGTDQTTRWTRTLVALVREEPTAALSYALFGNKIHFDNHNHVNYGLTLNTSVHSNSSVLVDRGVSITGQVEGVTIVAPNTGPASGTTSVPSTILTPGGKQGDPDPITTVASAPVVQTVPGPADVPFPTFDFAAAASAAAAAGRSLTSGTLGALITAAQTYAQGRPADGAAYTMPGASYPSGTTNTAIPIQVIHYKTSAGTPNARSITVPNSSNPNAFVPLGSADGTSNPAVGTNLYEIRFIGNPLADTLLYVSSALNLTGPSTTLLHFEGSIIVNGPVGVNVPVEMLAWRNRTGPSFVSPGQSLYTDTNGNSTVATTAAQAAAGQPYDVVYSNYPALAANGKLKIDSSGSSQGGPVHIEGVVYSVAESHLHKSDARESAYAVGSEVADVVHNCQWFSFAYDPRSVRTLGLSSRVAGRVRLQVIRIEEYTR